ncbi:pirin family protein [Rheinheimera sp.]|uniref:pirin family protein n=1 Tax=Rheinheimera sp. TaxID=1869214 RepID=UPI002FDDABB1
MSERHIQQLIPAQLVSDGAGVKIRRSLGLQQQLRLDPFLMLDCFGSEEAADYIAGFPPHPHRGFETVTYMLDGHMLHQDHLGNEGHLMSGGVQWMTAGSGIIHSEMPQQESGLMRGFQLWLNLPAAEKMKDPAYVDLKPAQLGRRTLANGGHAVVIAGALTLSAEQQITAGPIQGLSTDPHYYDLSLPAGSELQLQLPAEHNALVYPFEGEVQISADGRESLVKTHHAAVLGKGDSLHLVAKTAVRLLVLAAKPIGEPVVQYGPFVMNSAAEIEQAIRDYQAGKLTKGAAGTIKVAAV